MSDEPMWKWEGILELDLCSALCASAVLNTHFTAFQQGTTSILGDFSKFPDGICKSKIKTQTITKSQKSQKPKATKTKRNYKQQEQVALLFEYFGAIFWGFGGISDLDMWRFAFGYVGPVCGG